MDFQKINMRSRSEKFDFCLRDFLRQLHLKMHLKTIFYNAFFEMHLKNAFKK
jgi:hypothetical protein